MPSNFSNGHAIWSEHSNGDSSMALHLNSQVGELLPFEVNADPRTGTSMTTQMAWEINEIMEDPYSGDEESRALIKDLVTATTTSSPYFLDLADYTNEDGDGILATPNPTIVNSDETRNSSQRLNLLGSFPTEDSPLYMIGTSNGVLNNNHAMDDLTTMSRRYGVFPFIKKHRHMCFYNHKLSHLLGQRLTGPLPQLNDPTDMDRITDVQMTLAPKKNITLVLDIDGTLIHSSMRDEGADFSFPLLSGEKEYTVYVKKRPYVDAFLKKVAEMFEIAIFTASLSPYADQLLDILDREHRFISRRYYRESCLSVDGKYLKDLTIIEADLAKVAIIDNTPEVFQLQVNNGIPIKTWSSDPFDVSLPELIPFLETLAVAEDVRPLISNKFAS